MRTTLSLPGPSRPIRIEPIEVPDAPPAPSEEPPGVPEETPVPAGPGDDCGGVA